MNEKKYLDKFELYFYFSYSMSTLAKAIKIDTHKLQCYFALFIFLFSASVNIGCPPTKAFHVDNNEPKTEKKIV